MALSVPDVGFPVTSEHGAGVSPIASFDPAVQRHVTLTGVVGERTVPPLLRCVVRSRLLLYRSTSEFSCEGVRLAPGALQVRRALSNNEGVSVVSE